MCGVHSTLGKLFTYELAIRKEHTLVDRGPYRWLVHPSYTGFSLAFIGLGIMQPGLVSALMLAFVAALLSVRIRQEEAMLEKQFGDKFVA